MWIFEILWISQQRVDNEVGQKAPWILFRQYEWTVNTVQILAMLFLVLLMEFWGKCLYLQFDFPYLSCLLHYSGHCYIFMEWQQESQSGSSVLNKDE